MMLRRYDRVSCAGFAVTAALVFGTSCGGLAPTTPSPAPGGSAAGLTEVLSIAAGSALFGPSGADLARCLQGADDGACFAGARVGLRAAAAAATVAGAPTNLSTSSSGSTVTLTWGPPSSGDPVTTYVIEAGSGPGLANLAMLATNSTATTFSATGVGAGTYYVRVRARNDAGTSAASNESTLVVGSTGCTAAPNGPTGLTIATSGRTATITWTAPSGGCALTSYLLQAGSSPGSSNIANSNVGNSTSYVATDVPNGTYYVRVRAANAFGQSAASNEFTMVIGSGPPPPSVFQMEPNEPDVIDMGSRGEGCASSSSSRTFTVTTKSPTQQWRVTTTGFFGPLVSRQFNRDTGTGPGTFTLTVGFNPQTSSTGNCTQGMYFDHGGTVYLNAVDHDGFDYIRVKYKQWVVF